MKYSIEGSTLTDIANAIREQYGEDSAIAVSDMAEAILGIEGSGSEDSSLPFDYEAVEKVLTINSDAILIENPRGVTPKGAILVCPSLLESSATYSVALAIMASSNSAVVQASILTKNSPGVFYSSQYQDGSQLTQARAYFTNHTSYNPNVKFRQGHKYYCIFLY